MPQSLVQIYVHLVFSTKHREPFLTDPAFRSRVHAYLAGICKNQNSPSLRTGGVADHVHILLRLAKTGDIASLVRDLKRDSTTWIKSENRDMGAFHWQQGYGAFSVSPTELDAVERYIQNQEEHHGSELFQDEYRRHCKINGVEIDERYVWD